MTEYVTETKVDDLLASFPVGYYPLHPDASVNFRLNRFYDWIDSISARSSLPHA